VNSLQRNSSFFSSKTSSSDFAVSHLCKGIGRVTDIVIERGMGTYVWDEDGTKYLDFTSSIGVVNVGHSHPKIVKAIQTQAESLIHSQVNVSFHKPLVKLMERLLTVMPHPSLDSFFFWNSGAEAVEAALKLSRHATGKQNVIVFQGGYHGRTVGTMSMTTSKTIYRQKFGPLMPGVFVAPYPYAAQLPKNIGSQENMAEYCIEAFKQLLQQQTHPDETAALFVETVLGEGGYVLPPPGFLKEIQEICKRHGILYVADEVQCGYGRTGKMFAVEHYNIVPDVLVSAKGLASGCPLSVIVSRKELMDKMPPGVMGGTYAGNALSCASAIATLDIFKEENVLQNCNERWSQFMNRLMKMKEKYPIKDVRGLGLMVATEFEDSLLQKDVMKECYERRMLLLSASIFNTLRYIPPLTVSAGEIDLACDILEESIKAAMRK